MFAQPFPSGARQPALALLLARYLAGQVEEAHFVRLSALLDDTGATPEERSAFARFVLDVSADADEPVVLPTLAELHDVLDAARA